MDKVKLGLGKMTAFLEESSRAGDLGNGWLTGDRPIFADFAIAGTLFWLKRVFPEKWENEVKHWHQGIWAKHLALCESYLVQN